MFTTRYNLRSNASSLKVKNTLTNLLADCWKNSPNTRQVTRVCDYIQRHLSLICRTMQPATIHRFIRVLNAKTIELSNNLGNVSNAKDRNKLRLSINRLYRTCHAYM